LYCRDSSALQSLSGAPCWLIPMTRNRSPARLQGRSQCRLRKDAPATRRCSPRSASTTSFDGNENFLPLYGATTIEIIILDAIRWDIPTAAHIKKMERCSAVQKRHGSRYSNLPVVDDFALCFQLRCNPLAKPYVFDIAPDRL